jgi:hypothetical protein
MPCFSLRYGLSVFALGGLLLGCVSSSFVDQQYRRGNIAFRVGSLPAPWVQAAVGHGNLSFRHPQGGTVVVNAQCPTRDDVPLDVLTNHLLFGIKTKKEISRTPLTLDGRAALDSLLIGELDGVPVELELVVLTKDGCTYDLQLIASPEVFAARQPDFVSFRNDFGTLTSHARRAFY